MCLHVSAFVSAEVCFHFMEGNVSPNPHPHNSAMAACVIKLLLGQIQKTDKEGVKVCVCVCQPSDIIPR